MSRLKQPDDKKTRLKSIAAELSQAAQLNSENAVPQVIPWLPGFYSVPVSAPLSRLSLYQDGKMCRIDISSGYAVSLINIQPGEHVLDLCCAPGAKLAMIADLLQFQGSVTGVDYSISRLGVCRHLVYKYKLECVSDAALPNGDADSSMLMAGPSILDRRQSSHRWTGWRCYWIRKTLRRELQKTECNKSARERDAKRRNMLMVDSALYDKVLVDAECTHDVSIRHLQRLNTGEKWEEYVRNLLNSIEVERILNLQHGLIRNGFKMLRPGGMMIYST
ncbi:hypothetical protein PsorP6_006286 [Peronosclerospora sorghi]|uniref:Uncharacterized protein n=1 Tax=Peronosclerospora sorghi TaxID=230839 RepID=A0ACC0W5D3_9STRA|nr:hypothetical protein PsorP6_006286 [Peronosclerospora sorghi]